MSNTNASNQLKRDLEYWKTIPNEYRPHPYKVQINANEEKEVELELSYDGVEEEAMFKLFYDDDDDDDHESNAGITMELTSIGEAIYHLRPPPDSGTLFAHKVWSGSKLLAQYLNDHPDIVQNKYTIELGAGTALPSLVSLYKKSKCSIITDYPEEELIQALRETVGWNWYHIHSNYVNVNVNDHKNGNAYGDTCDDKLQNQHQHPQLMRRVGVIGHEWGKNIQKVQHFALQTTLYPETIKSSQQNHHNNNDGNEYDTNTEQPFYFDVAILSECLWMHRTHKDLAKSIHHLLHPVSGIAILTYAHHIPGCEKQDDAFFQICYDQYNLITDHIMTKSMPYMWDKDKSIDIHLKIIRRG